MHAFDVFRVEAGSFLWIGCADSLQAARELIKSQAANASEEFLILNDQTREKVTVRADGSAVPSKEPLKVLDERTLRWKRNGMYW